MMKQGTFEEHKIESWQDYQKRCEVLVPRPLDTLGAQTSSQPIYPLDHHKCHWVFRGQAKDWDLTSTVERLSHRGFDSKSTETDALNEFKRKTARLLSVRPESNNTLDWHALMQHYGAPTRLIDWTYSAYVAAYFACRDYPEEDGVVYALNLSDLDHARATMIKPGKVDLGREPDYSRYVMAPRNVDCSIATEVQIQDLAFRAEPTFESDRQSCQQGLFVTCAANPPRFQAALSRMSETLNRVLLYKWHIPAVRKPEMMRSLHFANVYAMSLFPDLDGIGKMIVESMPWKGVRQIGRNQSI
ncbi:MAG: FRG domain-containing protein [Bryobacteraceae bacterium]|nr:FRG domain-containing protein [Bryobacteraceae bacterium]